MPQFRSFNGIFDDGQTKRITCESYGSRPAANITWFINDKKISGAVNQVFQQSDGTFYVTSILTHYFDKSMDGSNLTCQAINDVLRRQNRMPLENTLVLRASCKYESNFRVLILNKTDRLFS